MSDFYMTDRQLEEPPPLEIAAFHFTRHFNEPETSFEWRFHAIKGYRAEITYNFRADPRAKLDIRNFYQFAYGSFFIVLDEPQFTRYAKNLVRMVLRVEPSSIVVKEKKTGRFSGAWPQAKRLEDRIRIDQLDFFGMEDGDVVVR